MSANREGVLRMIAWLQRAYPAQQHPDPERVGLYCERLSNYSLLDLQEAARHCVDSCRYFPTVAELVAVVDQRRRQVPKWTAPQLPAAELVTPDEVKQAVSVLLGKWRVGPTAQREPGSDDQ